MKQKELTSVFITLRERLRTFAARIVGTGEAEDVVQDAFIKLWANHPAVKDELSATRLAFTTVRNSAIDNLRHRDSHPTDSIGDSPLESQLSDSADVEYDSRPEDLTKAVINLSMRILKGRQREVFELHDLAGWDYDEIAQHLAMTPENVRMTLSRARKAIREMYNNSPL